MVFPELAVTGIISEYSQAQKWSEEIPGSTTELFTRKAEKENVFIVLGMAERKDGRFFNSSVLIGPQGVEGIYRKVHLSSYDKIWAEPGKGFPVFDLPFGRIGMLIGYDMMFPEAAECMAKMGTDILCVPTLWQEHKSRFVWDARLGEQMHLAVANQWGDSGQFRSLGQSAIYSYCLDDNKRQKVESPAEGESINIMRLRARDTRKKKFIEKIDYDVLLDKGGGDRRGDRTSTTGQDL